MIATLREPLPFEHRRGPHDRGYPTACSVPEGYVGDVMRDTLNCPGCRAHSVTNAVLYPHMLVRGNMTGAIASAVDAVRRVLDDFDPMRVLMERELERRSQDVW